MTDKDTARRMRKSRAKAKFALATRTGTDEAYPYRHSPRFMICKDGLWVRALEKEWTLDPQKPLSHTPRNTLTKGTR